jgi:hypothetical protein
MQSRVRCLRAERSRLGKSGSSKKYLFVRPLRKRLVRSVLNQMVQCSYLLSIVRFSQ